MLPPVSRLPMAPPSVIGLINHRGQVYRVISLRRKLGLESGPPRMEGQLMLTSLPSGLTAFLVDEVLEVLPDTHLPRRPLSPRSDMDLFDAFILRGEEVLFHTTFDRLDQARESAYPSPDLKTMAHMPAATPVQTTAPDQSTTAIESTALDEGETKSAAAPEKGPGQETIRPALALRKDHFPLQETRITRPPSSVTEAPATKGDPSLAQHRPIRAAAAQRNKRSRAYPARSRRYALALTAVLLLLLIVALSSGLLLKKHRAVSQPPQDGAQVRPLPTVAPQNPLPQPSPETLRTQSLAKDAVAEPPPRAARDRPSTASAPQMGNAVSPDSTAREQAPLPQTIARQASPIAPEENSGSSREILRMETETFTLLVERPSIDRQKPSASLARQVALANVEIVHRVVPGDTLWDIAEHYLGDPFQYAALARLSQIRNPDLIYPGDVIRIIKKER